MKQYVFLDWNLVTGTPVERTFCRGRHHHAALRISISLGAVLIAVILGFLFRNMLFSQASPPAEQPPPVPSTQLTRSASAGDASLATRQDRDADGRGRSAGLASNRASLSDSGASSPHNLNRETGRFGNLGGVVFWGTISVLGVLVVVFPVSALWQRISLEWDGKDHLTVTSHRFWPSRQSWSLEEIGGIAFGVREQVDRPAKGRPIHHGWFWFVHLLGKQMGGNPRGRILAELVAAHQHESPASPTGRALVPHKVKDLVEWLEECTHQRAAQPRVAG